MWTEDLKFGEKGEDMVYNHFRKSPKTRHIVDCSKDKYFQDLDIDFLIESVDGNIYKCEVKNDRQADETGNIAYEIKSNSNVGCLERSHADYVFYKTEKHLYWCKLKNLKKYISLVPHREVKGGDNATMYLISINDLMEANVLYELECSN